MSKAWTAAAVLVMAAGMAWGQGVEGPARAARNRALAADPGQAFDPGAVLVKFRADAGGGARGAARAGARGETHRNFSVVPGLEKLAVADAAAALAALRADPAVEYAEPDYVVQAAVNANDANYGWLWGLNNTGQMGTAAGVDIDAPEAWDTFRGDPNFVIAVIDDGTNWAHPDLAPNMWSNAGEVAGNGVDDDGNGYVDDVRGWDFWSNDNDPTSGGFHGTHVAGTIAAAGNNGVGVTGVVWQGKVMALRFIGPDGGYTSDAIEALQYAVAKGVKLSNNSWGGGGYSQALYDALNAARGSGHLFVAAAGNGGADQIGDNNDVYPYYPAGYALDNVISVAAVNAAGQLGGFSNYGAQSVDLAAPGVSIYSAAYDGYGWSDGTSMAAPHVSGVAALVWGQSPGMTYQQVRSRLLTTVRPLGALNGRTVTGGMVNAAAAIAAPVNTAPTVAISSPASGASFTHGAAVTFTGTASDVQDGSLSAGIAWTSSLQGALGTGASVSRSDLVVGTHTVTARVTDSGGMSGSASLTVTVNAPTPPPPPPPPTATIPLAPTSVTASASGGTVTVRWADASSNESGFEVQREQKQGSRWLGTTMVGSVGANVTSASQSVSRGQYRYRVRSFNEVGSSAWSAWANVNVK
ncbi:MAG TPA: S8 family serine peptidase [Phycisphaerales bacterium]|nr:S8 family serine peptidase [Phycisphaerales bacterium]